MAHILSAPWSLVIAICTPIESSHVFPVSFLTTMIGNGGKLSGQGLVDRAILHIDSYLEYFSSNGVGITSLWSVALSDWFIYCSLIIEEWAWQAKIATHICVCSHVEESQHMSLGRPTTVHAITEDWCNICILTLHSHHWHRHRLTSGPFSLIGVVLGCGET